MHKTLRYQVVISNGDYVAIFGEYETLADVEIAIRKWEIANPGSAEYCEIHDQWSAREWVNRNAARDALRAFAGEYDDQAPITGTARVRMGSYSTD